MVRISLSLNLGHDSKMGHQDERLFLFKAHFLPPFFSYKFVTKNTSYSIARMIVLPIKFTMPYEYRWNLIPMANVTL